MTKRNDRLDSEWKRVELTKPTWSDIIWNKEFLYLLAMVFTTVSMLVVSHINQFIQIKWEDYHNGSKQKSNGR